MYSGRRLIFVATTVGTLAVGGCGAVAGREDVAADTARRFLAAVDEGDGSTACALLAPDTVSRLEESSAEPCDQAVTEEDLPEPGAVESAQVYGQWAQVVLSGDTVFLAEFRDGWRVVAAGCRPRGERPYDCAVEGS